MKKFFLFISLFFLVDIVSATSIYISKKDIDTGEYVSNCDFLLYDSDGNVVDNWIQDYSYHFLNVKNGSYKLVSRPYVMGKFNDDLSSFYTLNVSNDSVYTVYDKSINTPLNLKSNFSYSGIFLIIIGFLIIISCKYSYN